MTRLASITVLALSAMVATPDIAITLVLDIAPVYTVEMAPLSNEEVLQPHRARIGTHDYLVQVRLASGPNGPITKIALSRDGGKPFENNDEDLGEASAYAHGYCSSWSTQELYEAPRIKEFRPASPGDHAEIVVSGPCDLRLRKDPTK